MGARLISHAGSLTNLAKYPASTVQILGAEKALFRYRGCPSMGVSGRPQSEPPPERSGVGRVCPWVGAAFGGPDPLPWPLAGR